MKRQRVHLSDPSTSGKFQVKDADSLHEFLAKPFEETPIWAGLYENFRDALFPPKLPPLE